MKITRRKSKVAHIDSAKTHKLAASMQQLSFDQRAKELGANTKIKLNLRGNRRGMHLQGDGERMKQLRAMRRLWNAKMPVMHCNNCAFSQQCPQFKAGYECAFNRFFDAHAIQNEDDLIFYAKQLCEQSMKRSQKMLLAETLSGGAPSLETSEAISIAFAQLMQLYDRVSDSAEVEIESSDSTIIGRLFGGLDGLMSETVRAVSDPITVPSSNAEALLEDTGVTDVPLDATQTPRKAYDPELVRAIAASSLGQTFSKPVSEELPV